MKYPKYSEKVVSLARAYDRADMLCRSGLWYFHDLKDDEPQVFGTFENEDDPAWVNHHMEMLDQSLEGMRRALGELIVQETQTFCLVELDADGYVVMPDAIKALLPDDTDYVWLKQLGWPVDKTVLAARVAEISEGRKAIVWDDEVFFFPHDMPDDFIEVWWRRLYSGPSRSDTLYPLYLEANKSYGWDCVGIER